MVDFIRPLRPRKGMVTDEVENGGKMCLDPLQPSISPVSAPIQLHYSLLSNI